MEMQKRTLGDLWEWDRNVLGDLERRINKVKKDLEKCPRLGISEQKVDREHLLQDQLNVYWKQRAHNTCFFF